MKKIFKKKVDQERFELKLYEFFGVKTFKKPVMFLEKQFTKKTEVKISIII